MAYKKLSGPEFPAWPAMYYDAAKRRAKISDSVLDWKGKIAWRSYSAGVFVLIFMPSVMFPVMAILAGQKADGVAPIVGVAVIAFCLYGFVISPLIKYCCKKSIDVVFGEETIWIGWKRYPRFHHGSPLSHTFAITADLDAQRRAQFDRKLNATQRFETERAQLVIMIVRSSGQTAALGGRPQTPGVPHRVASVLTDEQAVHLSEACTYLLECVDSEGIAINLSGPGREGFD